MVWIQSFPLLGHPARDKKRLVVSGSYARQFGLLLLIGYSLLTYTCAYACPHTYIYMHTHIIHIGPPAIRHLPTRHTVDASYLLRP